MDGLVAETRSDTRGWIAGKLTDGWNNGESTCGSTD